MPSGDRKERKEKKSRSHSSRRRSRREDDELQPSGGGLWGSLLGRLFCCSEVRCCPAGERERIAGERQHRRRDRDRHRRDGDGDADRERRRHRRRERDRDRRDREDGDGPGPGADGLPAASREGNAAGRAADRRDDDEASSGGRSARSAASCMSYASDMTGYSEATSAATSARSARSGRSETRSERRRQEKQASASAAAQPVKVMNLADLRGQELPPSLDKKQGPARREADEDERSQGGASARSGRSLGGQSVGGASVASVSIKKYMGYLSEERSPAEVKKMVKDFVRQMVKGREMGVLRGDGALKPVMCALTRTLDTFRIKSGSEVRKVPLAEVQRVIFGAPEELEDLETPLDDKCSTMELESSECISFKFPERKSAELFTLCMQLFIDGQRT